MYLTKNRLGVVVIIVAIISSVCGGFFLNGEEQTTCESDFQYVTDVSAVFTGTDSDMKVEYNPQSNVSGYSVTRPGDTSSTKVLGIEYTAASANGYWVQETTGDAVVRNLNIAPNPNYANPDNWKAEISIDNGEGEDPSTTVVDVKYPFIPNHKNAWASLKIGYYEYNHIMGITLQDLLSWYGGFTNTTGGISFPESEYGFPAFIAGVSPEKEVKTTQVLGIETSRKEITHINYEVISPSVEINASNQTAKIMGNTFSWRNIYVVWLPSEGIVDAPLVIGGQITTSYIDPVGGVRPMETEVKSVTVETETTYSTEVSGTYHQSSKSSNAGGSGTVKLYADTGWDMSVVAILNYYMYCPDNSHVRWGFGWSAFDETGYFDSGLEDILILGLGLGWRITLNNDGSIHIAGWTTHRFSLDVIDKTCYPEFGEDVSAFDHMELTAGPYTSIGIETDPSSCSHLLKDDTNNTVSTTVTGTGSTSLDTYKTETYTEDTTKVYNKTYWQNGYVDSDISILFRSTFGDPDEHISTATMFTIHAGASAYTVMIVDVYGEWTAGILEGDTYIKTKLGTWDGMELDISINNGILTISAIPCTMFENFRSYTMLDGKSTVIASLPVSAKAVDYLEYDMDNTKAADYLEYDAEDVVLSHWLSVVSTTILLEGGGLYTQNGVFSMEKSFPNDKMVRFRVMASAHVGDSMTVKASGGEAATFPATEDGWLIDGSVYPFDKLSVYYVSPDFESVGIGGIVYPGGIYVGADFYEKGHVYYSVGNGPLVDIGESDDGWTITLDGTWAVSTAYYEGENTASSVLVMGDPSVWGWSKEEFITVFIGVTIVGMIICAWRFETGIMDWAVPIGAVVICFSLLG